MTDRSEFYWRLAGRALVGFVLLVATALAVFTAIRLQAPHLLGQDKILIDFDAFHIAGDLARRGLAADAYATEAMRAAQDAVSDHNDGRFMPWTYPPPSMLLVGLLAHAPIGASYLLFFSASFVLYLLVLRKIAGEALPGALFVMLPTIMILAGSGQNGFLTGGLIGLFMLAFLRGRPSAGLPMGLMIVKPHLAAGIALMTLLERRWTTAALAAAVVATALLAATLVFGVEIWSAFQGSLRESGERLGRGDYWLNRMTSIYAFARSLGASADLAFAAHGAGILIALGLTLRVWRSGAEPRAKAAAFCLASLFVSPYNYNYDLTIFGLAVAFLLRDLLRRARMLEIFGLWLLSWIVLFYGAASQPRPGEAVVFAPSWTAPLLILLIGAAYGVLRRPERDLPGATPRPAAQGLAAV